VLSTGTPVPAKYGRRCTRKKFRIDMERQGKRYSQKMVEVYYVAEGDAIVVVTVYVFFGTWGG
jgi:ribosomal protein L21E